jgi:hypothetical protein
VSYALGTELSRRGHQYVHTNHMETTRRADDFDISPEGLTVANVPGMKMVCYILRRVIPKIHPYPLSLLFALRKAVT